MLVCMCGCMKNKIEREDFTCQMSSVFPEKCSKCFIAIASQYPKTTRISFMLLLLLFTAIFLLFAFTPNYQFPGFLVEFTYDFELR